MTPEQQAQKVLQDAIELRKAKFVDAYKMVCDEFGFEMHPVITFSPAGMQANIQPVQVK